MRVGIIGTGMLGSAVCLNLLNSGFEITAYNRTLQKTREIKDAGANIVRSPSEVAKNSDLVITIVTDAHAVNEISFGMDGIIKGKHKNLTVADMSTVNPLGSRDISDRFAEHGISKLDVPVMGGPNVAVTGDLVVMGSGDRNVFEKFRPVFEVIGNKVFYLGKEGVAHYVKLAMNLQIALLALALSEGLILMEGAKIKPEIFLEVLNSTYFKTGMSKNKAYKMIHGAPNTTFTLRNLKKDISIMVDTAEKLGIELPMIKKALEIYQNADMKGFGDIDYTGIISYVRKMNRHD